MSGDFSSANNDLLKGYNKTIMQDSYLDGIAGKQKAEQKSELKKIFAVLDDNNVTSTQKKSLESRAEILKDKLDRLEAEMAVLQEEIQKSQGEIKKHADEIADLVTAVDTKSKAIEKKQKSNVSRAISDVFDAYKRGDIQKDAISAEISVRVRQLAYKLPTGQVEALLEQLDAKQGQVQPLVDAAAKWTDKLNQFEGKYGAIKSSYDVINLNLTQIGNTDTNYTNSDYDAKTPIYSLEKTDIVSDFFENANMNVAPGKNPAYTEGSQAPSFNTVNEKYGKYFGAKATAGVDANSSKNQAVKNLSAAINGGMLTDLAQSGMNGQQISEFLAKNFGGANIKLNDQGSLSIPYGHDDASRKTFGKLTNFLKDYSSGFLGSPNTWDKEGGNQISTNKQIEALSKSYPEILNKMASDPKFTFKEAMYALFNQETGLFKDSGVIYDPSKLDKKGEPTYFVELAGDVETSKMYQGLAAKIKEIWGVGPSVTIDYDNYDENAPEVKPTPASSIIRTDPISFTQGDTEYAFVVDRDGDGTFSGKNEFVGAQEGQSWLDDLKALDTDGDGKLTGDELKNLKLLGSEYTDNAQTKANKAGFLREETTNIGYSMTDAASLGITEIDLNGLENNVDQSKGKNDINGSELFNDSFSFKLNGKDVTAERKDDTDAFMDAVYSDAYGKSFQVGATDEQAQTIIDNAYGEFDQYRDQFNDVFQNVGILKNADQIAQEARGMYNDAMNRMKADENIQLTRASNRAAALTGGTDWNSVSREVRTIANNKGVSIDMEQAKGMYIQDGSLTPEQIVSKYQDLVASEQHNAAESRTQTEAFKAITLCAKHDIKASSAEIRELLSSGQASTAEEVVNILKQKQG